MITRPLYPRGRLSAPVSGPHGERLVHIDRDLIGRLREARAQGDEAMTAAEKFDPDFSVKLSACTREDDAQRLLDGWFVHRVNVLKQIQSHFRRLWEAARTQTDGSSKPDGQSDVSVLDAAERSDTGIAAR
jgi:hypothetical protein